MPVMDRQPSPRGRIDADTAFLDLAKAVHAFVQAKQRGDNVQHVSIDPVTAAFLVESWITHQKAGGTLTLDEIMKFRPQEPQAGT